MRARCSNRSTPLPLRLELGLLSLAPPPPAGSSSSPSDIDKRNKLKENAGTITSTGGITFGLHSRNKAYYEEKEACSLGSSGGASPLTSTLFSLGTAAIVRWHDNLWHECTIGSVTGNGNQGTLDFPPTKGCSQVPLTSHEVDFRGMVSSGNLKKKFNGTPSLPFSIFDKGNKAQSPWFDYFPGVIMLSNHAHKRAKAEGRLPR